jgi:hypothetical protein
MNDLRDIIAMWLMERALDVASKRFRSLIIQGFYLTLKADIEGSETLPTVRFSKMAGGPRDSIGE